MIDGAFIELYRRQTSAYPLPGYAGSVANVARELGSPKEFILIDPWGTPLLYACSPDGQHYSLVSAGSDRRPDAPISWPYMGAYDVQLEDAKQDTVLVDGNFVRMQLSFNPDGPKWQERSGESLRSAIERGVEVLERSERRRWNPF